MKKEPKIKLKAENEIIEIIISDLDFYLIEKVRELRAKAVPYISQFKLSQKMNLAGGYVGKVESMKEVDRYNIRDINKLVSIFEMESYSELFPKEIIKNDIVRIRLKLLPEAKKGKIEVNQYGEVEKPYKILSKEALDEDEMDLWKENKLSRLKIIEDI